MKISSHFQKFLNRPKLTKQTRQKYYYRLRKFIQLHENKEPEQITTEDMMQYIESKNPLSDASKSILRSSFHAFFNFCGLKDNNPAKALPHWRENPRRVVLPKEDDVSKALDAAVQMCYSNNPVDVRDGLIFALAAVSGNRRGEILNIPIDDLLAALDHPQRTKSGDDVYRVYTSGKTGESILRFTSFHRPLIDKYLAIRPKTSSNHLFVNLNPDHERYGLSLSLVALNRARLRVCKAAGVKVITFQELRRRVGSMIADSHGVDVAAQMLNHSPESGDRVIRVYYYDPDKNRVDEVTAEVFGKLKKE